MLLKKLQKTFKNEHKIERRLLLTECERKRARLSKN